MTWLSESHLKTHTKGKQYQCDQAFSKNSHLMSHLKYIIIKGTINLLKYSFLIDPNSIPLFTNAYKMSI